MVPRGLIVAISAGVISAAIAGIVLSDPEDFDIIDDQKEDEGAVSIMTQKSDFKLGEKIQIKIINNGSKPIVFSDESYGLKITGLTGRLLYSPPTGSDASEFITMLRPDENITIEWDQTKNDGTKLNVGTYKIVVEGFDEDYNKIKETKTFDVFK